MEIRGNSKFCILAPLFSTINKFEVEKLSKFLDNESREIAFDLSNVSNCSIDFIEFLKNIAKKNRVGVFNIHSDVFALFNIMGIDKVVDLFVSENDFELGTHKLINRSFTIV